MPKPSWDAIYETASSQDGYFTLQQAREAGYSPQLLQRYLRGGRVRRAIRGVYQLVHFQPSEHEHLAVFWLWSERTAVFSHQTALEVHGLSDALKPDVELSLPAEWSSRRLRVPEGLVLHHADIPSSDRTWFGAVPVTTVRRTLEDCARDAIDPGLLRQAAQQALRRGVVTRAELHEVERALVPYGGISI